jgi:predicted RNA-binding Zn ribbon-like protein
VNTRADGAGRPECFATAAEFARWAARHDLLPADTAVSDSDAAAARELREALVTVLLAHADDPAVRATDLAAAECYLHQAGTRYPLRTILTAAGARLTPESTGVPGLFGSVLAAATEIAQHGDWARIKACCNPPCHFAFTDRTRNRTARYCSPGCASQSTMRAYRKRKKQAPSDPGADHAG